MEPEQPGINDGEGSDYFGEVSSGTYVKRYYTYKSAMVSYEMVSGSARKDYLTDYLGSITAEMNQTQSRTFDGRYFPYGQPLWFSGTPGTFNWVRSYGYRATGLFSVSHYVKSVLNS